MLRLTPFLLFDCNCAEAMKFYRSCFGGELTLTLLGDTPMKHGFPEEQHGKVTNVHLKSAQVEFLATDWLHPTRRPALGNTTVMYVTSEDLEGAARNLREARGWGEHGVLRWAEGDAVWAARTADRPVWRGVVLSRRSMSWANPFRLWGAWCVPAWFPERSCQRQPIH